MQHNHYSNYAATTSQRIDVGNGLKDLSLFILRFRIFFISNLFFIENNTSIT